MDELYENAFKTMLGVKMLPPNLVENFRKVKLYNDRCSAGTLKMPTLLMIAVMSGLKPTHEEKPNDFSALLDDSDNDTVIPDNEEFEHPEIEPEKKQRAPKNLRTAWQQAMPGTPVFCEYEGRRREGLFVGISEKSKKFLRVSLTDDTEEERLIPSELVVTQD